MLGYDTIHLYMEALKFPSGDLDSLKNLLSKEGCDRNSGEVWNTGNVGGMNVVVNNYGVSVKGSIAEFMYPDNVITVERRYMDDAIKSLSDSLHVDVSKMRVTRIDVSDSFMMKHPARAYYSCLGGLSRFERDNVGSDTLYYRQGAWGANPHLLR